MTQCHINGLPTPLMQASLFPHLALTTEPRQLCSEFHAQLRELVARKSRRLLRDEVYDFDLPHQIWTGAADNVDLPDDSVNLIVTSPPFLDVVDYKLDNWLRAWFCGHDLSEIALWQTRAFAEWYRVLKVDGTLCFEVGEVAAREVRLEIEAANIGSEVGFKIECVLINAQEFTKTAHLWGVTNGARGTNSNRVVVLRKP